MKDNPINILVEKARKIGITLLSKDAKLAIKKEEGAELTPELLTEIKTHREELIQFLEQQSKSKRNNRKTPSDYGLPATVSFSALKEFKASTAHPKKIEDIYPLGTLQEGMLFHNLYEGDASAYLVQFHCDLLGNFSRDIFTESWSYLMQKHSVLRTSFFTYGLEIPVQCVYEDIDLPIVELDFSMHAAAEMDALFLEFLTEDAKNGFEMENAPLFRITLIKCNENCIRMVLTNHHILWDGWSLSQLINSFMHCYIALNEGQSLPSIEDDNYGDHIRRVAAHNESRALLFWKEYLAELEAPSYLPFIQDASKRNKVFGDTDEIFRFSERLTKSIESYAEKNHLTVNTIFQGAWSYLLSIYTGQKQVVFGATISGRDSDVDGIENKVGMYINTIPVTANIDKEIETSNWLKNIQQEHTEARTEFGELSLTSIEAQSNVKGLLFDTILVFENYPVNLPASNISSGFEITNLTVEENTNYDLSLIFFYSDGDLHLRLMYNDQLLAQDTVEMIQSHMLTVLDSMTSVAERLDDLTYMTKQEEQRLVQKFNQTTKQFSDKELLLNLFDKQVTLNPEAVALLFEDQKLTYTQLDQFSNQVANGLLDNGLKKGGLVPICLERSLEMIVGILGVIKAGGAYVPVDPNYPEERLKFIMKDIKAETIITKTNLSLVYGIDKNLSVFYLDDVFQLDYSIDRPLVDIKADDLAYVIYTSGTTGNPKGVMIQHAALHNFICSMADDLSATPNLSMLSVTTFMFDMSILEFFLPISCGGSLILANQEQTMNPEKLTQLISETAPSHMQTTPSRWQMLLDIDWNNSDDIMIISGGEAISDALKNNLARISKDGYLWNFYGPTETTIWSVITKISAETPNTIGKPIANTQIYILSKELALNPVGVAGELYIGGSGLSKGYLHRQELTNERFISSPFNSEEKIYKTGDLACWMSNGTLQYLGRNDDQVKLRGYRIELGEIETNLEQFPEIRNAVVLAKTDTNNYQRLVAYIIPETEIIKADLQSKLKTKLPDYMIPSVFIELKDFPLTNNGKINRRGFPEPSTSDFEFNQYVAPTTELEIFLVNTLEKLLDVKPIGVKDDFFALGGHSLLAIRLVSAIRREFHINITVRSVFDYPTVETLAEFIHVVRGMETMEESEGLETSFF
jgi:amino acid adenylation domain-containing protein